MSIQDIIKNDSSSNTYKDIYHPVNETSFYLNLEGISDEEKIVTNGNPYILLSGSPGNPTKVSLIKFLESFQYKGILHLLLIDIETEKVVVIKQPLDSDDNFCYWRLLSMNYLKQRLSES